MTETVYIGLGSDLGDREQFLAAAVQRLQRVEGLEVIAVSALYLTHPIDMPEGSPPFLNQVVKADCDLKPQALLEVLEEIEVALGRTDKGESQPRTIDLDMLLFGKRKLNTKTLVLPHPKMLRRPFVLVPLLQIDRDLKDPVSGKPLASFLSPADLNQVKLYKDHVAREV